MRFRLDLERGVEVTATAFQEIRDALPVGNGKTGAVFLNVHRNNSTSATTFDILTSADGEMPDLSTTGSFWGSSGSTSVAASATGLFRFDIGTASTNRLGQLLRWKASGMSSGSAIHFSIVVFLADT